MSCPPTTKLMKVSVITFFYSWLAKIFLIIGNKNLIYFQTEIQWNLISYGPKNLVKFMIIYRKIYELDYFPINFLLFYCKF